MVLTAGNPGHGSRFIENTAAEKVQYLINKLLGYREEQKKKFEADPNSTLGDVTTVNLTTMSGGVQQNVVPNEFVIGFDIRITPTTNLKEFEAFGRNVLLSTKLLALKSQSIRLEEDSKIVKELLFF